MQTFPTSRLEAFSDGVFAVIITIMVLDLKVPHQEGVAGFLSLAPPLGIYALSFAFIGIYWVNHHMLLQLIREASPRILWANLIWLFCASLLPFFTAYTVEHHFDSFSVSLYATCLIACGLSFMLLRVCVSGRQKAEGTFTKTEIALTVKHWGSLGAYAVAIPLAFRWPLVSLLILAVVTGIWVIPTLGVEHSATCGTPPNQTPTHSR
jgi:uncharacterized membrane protein